MNKKADLWKSGRTANLLIENFEWVETAIDWLVHDRSPVLSPTDFNPGFHLPKMTPALRDYLSCAEAAWWNLGTVGGRRLALLDLMRNPATGTTKTFASLLIVARAVAFIRETGRPIKIICPTSGNKGIALRDAVERAIRFNLATPEELSIIVTMPQLSAAKLRESALANDPDLKWRNPVGIYDGVKADNVKVIAREFVDREGQRYHDATGGYLWYSLDIRNYKIADAARARFEASMLGHDADRRIHAHSVSSAYGLLGYNLGRDVLEEQNAVTPRSRPGFLLVQHMGTPDMVLNLLNGSFDRANLPAYRPNPETGLLEQDENPHFPATIHSENEVLDRTFYTEKPPTSLEMNALIKRHGGTGIVVSLAECLALYNQLRDRLSSTDIVLPTDPRDLREWSLVMAFTGSMLAARRGLLPEKADVVIHGSGTYKQADYRALPATDSFAVSDYGQFHSMVMQSLPESLVN